MKLGDLVSQLNATLRAGEDSAVPAELVISDVTHDSREARDGSLFCCVVGASSDGHDHAQSAIDNGAVAILCERPLPVDVPQLITTSLRREMSRAASLVWGQPSKKLKVVGVTGTNGKTTIVSMITAVLNASGTKTEMIGTLTGERTTPEATDLHRKLAAMVDDGVAAVAMEVSSHALVLLRVADVDFDEALFTNLGRDHLDFHGTQEEYFAAKAMLFEPGLSRHGIVNVDDVHGRLLADAAQIPTTRVSLSDASNSSTHRGGTTFGWRGQVIDLPMVGSHNVSNALLAATACSELGVSESEIAVGLGSLPQVPGRFEMFTATGEDGLAEFNAVVDYAHTPDALDCTLDAARELAGEDHKVIVVFGCGGDRDRDKRPEMGAIAAAKADVGVITSDNPRSEEPQSIIDQIVNGFTRELADTDTQAELVVDSDRRAAIYTALSMAGDGDVVLIAGKGHETGQTAKGKTDPFDDREVVSTFIASGGRV